jgi:hypothetical protein
MIFFFIIYQFWATTTTKKKEEVGLIMAQNCISTALTKLKNPRNEKSYNNFMAKANWKKMGLDHADFPTVRNRRIKKITGKKATDSSLKKFGEHSYYEVFDTMCSNMNILYF